MMKAIDFNCSQNWTASALLSGPMLRQPHIVETGRERKQGFPCTVPFSPSIPASPNAIYYTVSSSPDGDPLGSRNSLSSMS